MKTNQFLIILIAVVGLYSSCKAQSEENNSSVSQKNVDKVEVYYFHYTRRCATCNAVESVSREAVKEYYGDKVTFTDYNLDEKIGESKGNSLGISGQTLVIISGDTKIDITNEGFMNARSNPDKLKKIIKDKIDPLVK